VSSRSNTKLEEEDLADEDIEAEGRKGRRHTLQCYSAYDPDEARMEGEGYD
jgi:hypothetical protein